MGIYRKIFSNPNEEDTANVVRASHWAQYLKWTLEPRVCPEKEPSGWWAFCKPDGNNRKWIFFGWKTKNKEESWSQSSNNEGMLKERGSILVLCCLWCQNLVKEERLLFNARTSYNLELQLIPYCERMRDSSLKATQLTAATWWVNIHYPPNLWDLPVSSTW